ncbi:DUF6797 domain-containing protein [Rhodopirellula sp. MGV]|uniref:DUF6797 domain-containing protein n=1 Tax=Rhodopirellula sp. MGV TaxID=2023130 RepID=UPI000B969C30|nr:DUF6797 domain-containing protein [Rhodopirellula sp. MGV]OYP28928.1 hypothetical protein CGZ80_25515 [Rhodopirellula sp. MGV]PNY36955.1 hypothetical protein C2E31_10090 [Rhodopirellula baltica]
MIRVLLVCLAVVGQGVRLHAQSRLHDDLVRRSASELAQRSRVLGDVERGGVLFYSSGLGCVQCHSIGEGQKLLGPDLAELGERATFRHVLDSILRPNQMVLAPYVAETFLLDDGVVVTGLVRQQSATTVQLAVPGEEAPRSISLANIEARKPAKSVMPTGLINQLGDETDVFDLVAFVVALGQAGPEKAASLVPDPGSIAAPPLPAYEANLDHAGMIASLGERSFANGQRIYNSLCINCHGTEKEAGSLPNALRFALGKFKNGSDPYSIYKTVTHGFKMMLPQRQLVPQQKYDVIHYIREAYLKKQNADQYVPVTETYLASLPKGDLRGPAAVRYEPWLEMDYGPFLISTYEITGPDTKPRLGITDEERRQAREEGRPPAEVWPDDVNFAYKGIGIRLDSGQGGVAAGSRWVAFDHDTMRVAGAWSGQGYIDWHGILFNGNHNLTPRTVGQLAFGSVSGPGWADPKTGSFDDPRLRGKDGRAYGPLPRHWARYRGLYKNAERVIVSYSVGNADVLESHSFTSVEQGGVWTRTLNIGKSSNDLKLRLAPSGQVVASASGGFEIRQQGGYSVVAIAAEQTPVNFQIRLSSELNVQSLAAMPWTETEDLNVFTKGGPQQWHELQTQISRGAESGAFSVDTLTRPIDNPWKSRLRMSGLDFYPEGNALVACCCDGDVWRVDGISDPSGTLTWKRIASGLFHPLGIKIVNGRVHVACRDQIVVLNDLNGDGEADFYECFNNDHQVTDHFHEFAMGLQADNAGNLYYAKSARHARDSLVPHHGTLLKVSADGEQTTILANGFRAANGVCLNPDGSFFVTDQEGHWNPMNRINRVVEGGFYGNMYSYDAPQDSSDDAMEQPLCWPNKPFDRSPSELVWVEGDAWGPLKGSLLNLSYGYGKVFIVPHEQIDDMWQGGMCELPLPRFPTGIMRARFSPQDGQMYACGMQAWGSDQEESPGGLYRIRATGEPSHLPVALNATGEGMVITFSEPLEPVSASQAANYLVETWDLKRTKNYGSPRYNEQLLAVQSVDVSEDGKTVKLVLPKIQPTWTMQISYKLLGEDGRQVMGTIENTIHRLGHDKR